jgi:hypothetical protein
MIDPHVRLIRARHLEEADRAAKEEEAGRKAAADLLAAENRARMEHAATERAAAEHTKRAAREATRIEAAERHLRLEAQRLLADADRLATTRNAQSGK